MMYNMVKEQKYGLMVQNTEGIINMAKNTVLEFIFEKMDLNTTECGLRILYKDMLLIFLFGFYI